MSSEHQSTPSPTPSVDEVRDQIEHDRAQLARTVDELGARLDVKARAKHRVEEVRARLTTEDGKPTTQAWTAAGVALGVVLVTTIVLARRSRSR